MKLEHYPLEGLEKGAGFIVPCTPENGWKKRRDIELDLIALGRDDFMVWVDEGGCKIFVEKMK